jgi:hypothetical protein
MSEASISEIIISGGNEMALTIEQKINCVLKKLCNADENCSSKQVMNKVLLKRLVTFM